MSGPARILAALLLCAGATAAEAARIDREVRESRPVRPGMRLHLEHGMGDVTVSPWDRSEVEIHVRYLGRVSRWGFGGRLDFVLELHESGDTLVAVGREIARGGLQLGGRSYSYDAYAYTVRAPSWLRLDLAGDDGEVRIEGWRANVGVRLGDGAVTLSGTHAETCSLSVEDGRIDVADHEGALILAARDAQLALGGSRVPDGEIALEDGQVVLDGCSGSFDLYAQDASVDLRRHRAENLEVVTENGAIRLDLAGQLGESMTIDLVSDDGRVELVLDPEISTEVQAEVAAGGEIRFDVEDAVVRRASAELLQARVGRGGSVIRLRSWSGGVVVRRGDRAGDATAPAPLPPSGPA